MLLMIDNYDSFTYNIVQYFGELGEDVRVHRNDEITIEQIEALNPDRICISPGPKAPAQAGISVEVLKHFAGKKPILGVCLGHQAIGEAFGGKIIRAKEVMHGKTSPIAHTGEGVFKDLPSPFTVIRYHSLAIERASLPACLEVTAQDRCRRGTQRCHRREPVDRRHVLEDEAHAVLGAFRVPRGERACGAIGVDARHSRALQAATHLARHARVRLRVERVAAEEVDLLQLREESRARAVARHALELVDGQVLARLGAVGEELVAAIVVAGDDERVALHPRAACRFEPVGAAVLDELDEFILAGTERLAKGFLLVRGIDGDGAYRLLFGRCGIRSRHHEQREHDR